MFFIILFVTCYNNKSQCQWQCFWLS